MNKTVEAVMNDARGVDGTCNRFIILTPEVQTGLPDRKKRPPLNIIKIGHAIMNPGNAKLGVAPDEFDPIHGMMVARERAMNNPYFSVQVNSFIVTERLLDKLVQLFAEELVLDFENYVPIGKARKPSPGGVVAAGRPCTEEESGQARVQSDRLQEPGTHGTRPRIRSSEVQPEQLAKRRSADGQAQDPGLSTKTRRRAD